MEYFLKSATGVDNNALVVAWILTDRSPNLAEHPDLTKG